MSATDRGAALEAIVAERGLDGLLVTKLLNLRWLTGFEGTNGACLCGPGGLRTFFTDFRYTEQARSTIPGWRVETISGEWDRGLGGALLAAAEAAAGPGENRSFRVGFEDDQVTVRGRRQLERALSDRAGKGEGGAVAVELVESGGAVERLRRVKNEAELAGIAAAAELTDRVYREVLERGLQGRTERDVARFALERMRAAGAEPSFPPIVAAGPNGALPHAMPSERPIAAGELVVFDMGAELDGFCSDCTRTFLAGRSGPASDRAAEVYGLVLEAQLAALAAIRPGETGRDVDAVARDLIAAAGFGEYFGHGLGHGVGLEVHEAPRLSPLSSDSLVAGDVVTVEPGIYLPGELGVRIEDLVVVTEAGYENLSGLPKGLEAVG